jgi:hypothetical protein
LHAYTDEFVLTPHDRTLSAEPAADGATVMDDVFGDPDDEPGN